MSCIRSCVSLNYLQRILYYRRKKVYNKITNKASIDYKLGVSCNNLDLNTRPVLASDRNRQ